MINESYPKIVDDLPEAIPVLSREIDVIETYLGGLLDQMMLPKQMRAQRMPDYRR
jgi:hypothetical protein